jgi:hypothetical protein
MKIETTSGGGAITFAPNAKLEMYNLDEDEVIEEDDDEDDDE